MEKKATINKKWLVIIITLIVVGGILVYVFNLLNSGTLVVSSDQNAQLSIIDSQNHSKKIGVGNSTVRLKPGFYAVDAAKDASDTRQSVQVQARKTYHLSLDLHSVFSPKAVIKGQTAYRIKPAVTDATSLIYLNGPFSQLFQSTLNGASSPKPFLANLYPVRQADWLNDGGAVISTDGYSVYVNDSGASTNIYPSLDAQSSYVVAASGDLVYVDNNKLMLMEVPSGVSSSATLATLPRGSYNLSITRDGSRLFVYSDLNSADAKVTNKRFNNYIVDIPSGKKADLSSSSAVTAGAWSDNGKYLAFSRDQNLFVYDSNTASTLQIFIGSSSSPTWPLGFLDKNLIFAKDSALWEVQLPSTVMYKIASYGGSLSPGSFTPIGEKGLYFSTNPDSSGSGGNIYKLDL